VGLEPTVPLRARRFSSTGGIIPSGAALFVSVVKTSALPAPQSTRSVQYRLRGSSRSGARFDVALNLGHSRRMVALDEIAEARRWQIEQAHRMRLEGLVEDIRNTLEGPSSATEKVAWLKELLAVQGYRVR
jgi:hypothetical protein